MSWPNKVYSKSMVPKYTRYNDTNMLFRYGGVKRDGKYLDASGNGNNSIATLIVSSGDDNISFTNGTSYVKAPTLVNPATQSHTMAALVNGSVIAGATYGVILGAFAGATLTAYGGLLLVGSTVYLVWFNGASTRSVGSSINTNLKNHYSYVVDLVNNAGYLYVNSVLGGTLLTADIINPGTVSHGLGAVCYVALSTQSLEGNIKDGTLWNRALSSVDLRKEWLQYATMVQLKTGWGAKVSIANENTVGNFVGNGSTPFEILSGTWKTSTQLVDGELHKVVECVAAGTVWLDRHFMNINSSEAAYGSWRLSYGHAKDTVNVAHIGLTSTSKAAWDGASNTGYVLRLSATAAGDKLLRYSGGGAANLCFNMPNSSAVTNQVQITRRFDNVWQGYQTPSIVAADALATPPWAPSTDGPFTDATYTTSAGMSFTFNPGDWVSLGNVRDNYSLTKYLGEFDPREV